jgi:hypothetical protein
MSIHTLDSVYTVWHEALQEAVSTRHSLLFKRNAISFDRSIDPFEKGSISAFRTTPAVAAIQYNVYVVWSGSLQSPNVRAILYRRSTDGGANFPGNFRQLSSGNSSDPAIAAPGNKVHVVWHDNSPGNKDIFYARSTDDGANFGSPMKLSDTFDSTQPAIAASGNNVHVVWVGFSNNLQDISYKRSTDGGANFGSTVNLSNVTFAGGTATPAIAVSNNLII